MEAASPQYPYAYPCTAPLGPGGIGGMQQLPMQEPQAEPLSISIVVPDDARPGTKLEYVAPDGQELCLTVPPNVPPGSMMVLTQNPFTNKWKCVAEPADISPPSTGRHSSPSMAPWHRHDEMAQKGGMYYAAACSLMPGQTGVRGEPVVADAVEETISIVVPEGILPGTALHHTAPDGQDLRLTIPEGVPAGSVMTLTRDPATMVWKCVAEPAETPREDFQAPAPAYYSAPAPSPAEHYARPAPVVHPAQAQAPAPVASIARPAAAQHMPVKLSYVPPPQSQQTAEYRPSYTPPPRVVLQGGSSYVPPPVVTIPASAPQVPLEGRLSYKPPIVYQQSLSYVPPPVSIVAPVAQPPGEQRPSYIPPIILPNQLSYIPPPVTVLENRPSYTPLPRTCQRSITPMPRVTGQVRAIMPQPEPIMSQAASSRPSPYAVLSAAGQQGNHSYVPPPAAVVGSCQNFSAHDCAPMPLGAPYMGMPARMAGHGPPIASHPPEQHAVAAPAAPMGGLPNAPMTGPPPPMGLAAFDLPPIGLDLPPLFRPQIGVPFLGDAAAPGAGDFMQLGGAQSSFYGGMGNYQAPFRQIPNDTSSSLGYGLSMAHNMETMPMRNAVHQSSVMPYG